ncbi:hypothetical protein ARMGADRAFT_943673 [Armillaria gallica]|uniref:Uncharacterized protein n=1 Tax=Armillaria gallica TaxID=47427 RepID=A0A2H3D7N4_ARMGA|nr:hypothetical protein ARMGADRAFT_943673 [Armillaria gallica]
MISHCFQDFIQKLKDHILSQLLDCDDIFTDLDQQNLIIVDNHLCSHQILRINYTTYDAHRNQDSINPRTHSDIMALSPHTQADLNNDNNAHPYLYARVIGIFHARVHHIGPKSLDHMAKNIQFLWVRWYAFDGSIPSGFRAKHLPCIGFLQGDDREAFGFVNPSDVLHASHIMPAYIYGQMSHILPHSICRRVNEKDMDWACYYVDM